MRVMCVKAIDNPSPEAMNKPRPVVGDIDTVADEVEFFGTAFYELERFGDDSLFAAECFATLPDADEIKEEEETAIANLQPA